MSLAGTGVVAIWNDITDEGRANFYAWHGREHVPERVGIPGFLRGRRYVALHGSPEFFTLYEADTPQTLTGQDYQARLNAPTPWTLRSVSHFRNVARSLCTVAGSQGLGQGGLIATLRYDVPDDAAEDHRRQVVQRLLPELAARPGVAGAHLLVADRAASAVDTAERKSRGEANRVPGWILLLEGWDDQDRFGALARDALGEPILATGAAAEGRELGLYRLQLSRAKLPWSAG